MGAERSVERSKSCATIESGKWVEPANIAFDAEVVQVNDGLTGNRKLANSDPYGEGWMVKVRPKDWAAAKAGSRSGYGGRGAVRGEDGLGPFAKCA